MDWPVKNMELWDISKYIHFFIKARSI